MNVQHKSRVKIYVFLVTRAASKWLENHKYDKMCRIKICRRPVLDGLALQRPMARRITRHRSMQNLSRQTPPQNLLRPKPAQNQLAPVLDMSKIRSILKKPSDKAQNIFCRRKSMPDLKVTFANKVELIADTTTSNNAETPMESTSRQLDTGDPNSGKKK